MAVSGVRRPFRDPALPWYRRMIPSARFMSLGALGGGVATALTSSRYAVPYFVRNAVKRGTEGAVANAVYDVTSRAIKKVTGNAGSGKGYSSSYRSLSRYNQAGLSGSYRGRRSFRKFMPKRRIRGARRRFRRGPFKRRRLNTLKYRSRLMSKAMPTTLVVKQREGSSLTCATNLSNWSQTVFNDGTAIEANMAYAKAFDPTNPGTLLTTNLSTGTYSRGVFYSVFGRMKYTNNCHIPVRLTVYHMRTVGMHAVNFNDSYAEMIKDSSNQTLITAKLLSPEDLPNMRKYFKITKKVTKLLKPGDVHIATTGCKMRKYDPSYADYSTAPYSVLYGTRWIIARVDGVLSHDTTPTTDIGDSVGTIDIQSDKVYTYKYDGGFYARYIHTIDNSQSIDTAIVAQPATGNYNYSLAQVNS